MWRVILKLLEIAETLGSRKCCFVWTGTKAHFPTHYWSASHRTSSVASVVPLWSRPSETELVCRIPRFLKTKLKVFFESHDPTQGMRQGNDVGTQYRSGVYYYSEEQRREAEAAAKSYAASLKARGFGAVTTEILPAPEFYFAEDYHQQYLAKNPRGYCGLGGTGVACQIGTGVSA